MDGNVNFMQRHDTLLEIRVFQIKLDDRLYEIQCADTRHGHCLIHTNSYAVALLGCKREKTSQKIAVVAARIPELDHKGRDLIQHDKACMHESTFLIVN